MFRYILVPSTGSEQDRPLAEMALRAAHPSSAHIAFLHVRMDIEQEMAILAASGMLVEADLAGLREKAGEREDRARESVRRFCAEFALSEADAPQAGLSASWSMVTGEERACLAQGARVADAIVLGRGGEDDLLAGEVLGRALIETGRPVLIAPSAPVPEKLQTTVAIAWKDQPEAARAVTAAMPFIAAAERVVILSVWESGEEQDKSVQRLRHALQWHNPQINAERLVLDERPVPRILMEAAAGPRVAASLLVMGGYSHTRLREAIFGGFTRHVLAGAEIPVLMAH